MAQLEDFITQNPASLDDFNGASAEPPVTSAGSNSNLAAHAAMLSPNPEAIVGNYQQAKEEMDFNGASDTAASLIQNAKGESLQGYRKATAEFLADPSVTEEWKRNALNFITDENNGLTSSRAMVATHAASKPVPEESQESADLRGVYAATIQKALSYQRSKQQFYNEMQALDNNNTTAKYIGIAEDFIPLTMGAKQRKLSSDLFGDEESTLAPLWSSVFLGTSKAVMADRFNKLPLDARIRFFDKISDVIQKDGSSILLPEEFDNANMDAVRTITDAGHYSVTQETIDNVIGVADIVGVGSILRGLSKARKVMSAADSEANIGRAADHLYDGFSEEQRSWARRFVFTDVQPTSASQTVRDANPEMARGLHQAATADTTGDTARAVYGTSREDAIIHDITPQPASPTGAVESKVNQPERAGDFDFMPDSDVLDFVDNTGAHWLAPSEKRGLRATATNDFTNATGMVNRKEMTTIEATDDGVKFGAVYGPTDSGWSSVKDAVETASFNLKAYGVTEDNISILIRKDDQYVPISMDVAKALPEGAAGDFLLRIDHDYKFNTANIERDGWEAFDVKNNIFDRWLTGNTHGQGTLQSHLLDPQSMLHPGFTKGATISGLRGAGLERDLMSLAKPYVDTMKKLSGKRREKVFSKIRENNFKGQDPNYPNMVAEGFTPAEIRAVEQWKKAQDTLYELTNRDMLKTYQGRGYGLMEHQSSGTRLIVRELKQQTLPDSLRVFDPISNQVVVMDRAAMQAHYATDGNISRTASPITVGTDVVEHVLNANKAGSTYVRAFKNTDRIMNYRKGYYAVRYQNPHFVERKVVDANGRPILNSAGQEQWRAVATASNIPDATRAVERLTRTSGGEYRFRSDLKGEEFNVAESQRMVAGGMSAQRVRGARLEEALGNNALSEAQHIASPMESLVHSVASVSARVSLRDWLETSKQRFINQYADVLPTVRGQIAFPTSRGDIGLPHNSKSKMAGDARTTWEYIRQMENGYINSIDDVWKAGMNMLADMTGTYGFGKGEDFFRAIGTGGPTAVGKKVAFNLLLATNPLRQLLIQSHQMIMLGAVFPRYTFTRLMDDMSLMMVYHLGGNPTKALLKMAGRTEAEAKAMFSALKSSNISAGISKHELVRSSLMNVADGSTAAASKIPGVSTITRPLSAALSASRKVGFDLGEYLSSAASFLAHYDDAVSKGIKMGKEGIDDVTSKSRNFVYNMDQAGAVPYNHNSVALITQFMQIAHKALLQMTFNRGLTPFQKGVITAYTMMMFGPTSVIGLSRDAGNLFESYLNEILPEDPGFRNNIINGLENVLVNRMLTGLYGQDVKVDTSSLAPLDAYGITEFFHTAMDEGMAKLVTNSPAGSLIFGNNPRLTNVAVTAGRLMGLGPNPVEEDPVKWSNLAMDVANLSSGFSNAYKAAFALEYGRKLGALGGISNPNVNSFEAVAKAFGLDTMDEYNTRKIMDATYKTQEAMEADVKKVFSQFARQIQQQDIGADQMEYYIRLNQMAMSTFKGNPAAMDVWKREMRKQTSSKNDRVMDTLLKQCGWAKSEDVKRLINRAPGLTEEQRANLMAVCDYNFENRPDLEK